MVHPNHVIALVLGAEVVVVALAIWLIWCLHTPRSPRASFAEEYVIIVPSEIGTALPERDGRDGQAGVPGRLGPPGPPRLGRQPTSGPDLDTTRGV
ncbi:hypothetical protein F4775DRAFT_540695 [Biscogniauxia sp. FL1348]|nr:hypothetical protein F4775DRAFT_540695 [Biscogniauxia sp. FL1348]